MPRRKGVAVGDGQAELVGEMHREEAGPERVAGELAFGQVEGRREGGEQAGRRDRLAIEDAQVARRAWTRARRERRRGRGTVEVADREAVRETPGAGASSGMTRAVARSMVPRIVPPAGPVWLQRPVVRVTGPGGTGWLGVVSTVRASPASAVPTVMAASWRDDMRGRPASRG